MYLWGKAFVFLLIGYAYSQNDDFEKLQAELERVNNQLNHQMGGRVTMGNGFDFNSVSNHNNNFMGQNQGQNIAPPMMAEILQALQKECSEAGQQSIINSLEERISKAMQCISLKINPEELQNGFGVAQRTNTMNAFFQKLCTFWPEVHNCIKPLLSDIKQCLDKESKDVVDLTVSLVEESNTFFCENNAERIIEFINDNGPECIQTSNKNVGPCVADVIQKRKPKENNQLPLTYDSEDCSDFGKVRSCVVKELAKCQSKGPAKIADEYLALIQRKVCNSASALTWFSTLNIVLVLCTFLYSKIF